MKAGRVTLVCNVKYTFVMKDVELLERMGYYVYLIHSPPYRDPFRFFVEPSKGAVHGALLCFFFRMLFSAGLMIIIRAIPLFWAKLFGKPTTIIVGGFDAVSSKSLVYGIFLKKNLRQSLARLNYKRCDQIWVVHSTLRDGCPKAKEDSATRSGIRTFMPELTTPIQEVPTAYDNSFWRLESDKKPKSVITVANISDSRTLERKGIPLFIDLARSLPDFSFHNSRDSIEKGTKN